MRQLGTLPTQDQTRRFVDYLLTQGIQTRAEQRNDAWSIWVVQEDDSQRSKEEFQRFKNDPDNTRYQGRESDADSLRMQRHDRILRAQKNLNIVRGGTREPLLEKAKRVPVTFAIIGACVVVAMWTQLGANQVNSDPFGFVSGRHQMDEEWDFADPNDAMVDIRNGQYWRLVAPILLHLGPIHLLFNMLWLNQLGGQVEARKGPLKYIAMIIALAVFSNLFQVYGSKYPFFGGMSGVVYGLFGYVWMKSRFDPDERFYIDPGTVVMMLAWFAVCFLPSMNGVANGGHAGGLLLGIAMGYVSSRLS